MMYRLFELRLMSLFYERYRRIWVQRSKYSVCLTLFPRSGGYRIVTSHDLFHGFGQQMEFEQLVEIIQSWEKQ
jgi:hypothetical protein